MDKIKRFFLAALVLIIPCVISTALKWNGIILGAIPTVIIYAPFFAWARNVFRGKEESTETEDQVEQ